MRAAQDLVQPGRGERGAAGLGQVGIDAGGAIPRRRPRPSSPAHRAAIPPPPSQPLPSGCSDVVVNGTFEQAGGWTEEAQGASIIDPELLHTGKRSAWLGGTDQEAVQYIYQDMRLPANATSVQLSYYRLIHREVSGVLALFAEDAKFSVLLANTSGDTIATIEELASRQGDDTWRQARVDLKKYAGKTVRLVFSAENPRGNVSSFFVDDVTMAVCTSGNSPAPVPAPAPAQNGVVPRARSQCRHRARH